MEMVINLLFPYNQPIKGTEEYMKTYKLGETIWEQVSLEETGTMFHSKQAVGTWIRESELLLMGAVEVREEKLKMCQHRWIETDLATICTCCGDIKDCPILEDLDPKDDPLKLHERIINLESKMAKSRQRISKLETDNNELHIRYLELSKRVSKLENNSGCKHGSCELCEDEKSCPDCD